MNIYNDKKDYLEHRYRKLASDTKYIGEVESSSQFNSATLLPKQNLCNSVSATFEHQEHLKLSAEVTMSSKEGKEKSRDEIKAAREAKKLAKQKAKNKGASVEDTSETTTNDLKIGNSEIAGVKNSEVSNSDKTSIKVKRQNVLPRAENIQSHKSARPNSKDEVDKGVIKTTSSENIRSNEPLTEKCQDLVKAERAAKKALKQGKKKGDNEALNVPVTDLTVKDVVNTLKDIVNIAKEVQSVTARVEAIDLGSKKPEETKTKAELRAERRAKQEAQRAAKQSAVEKSIVKQDASKSEKEVPKEEKSVKVKTLEKPKVKVQSIQKMNWFGTNLLTEHNKEDLLRKISLNSNMHPAIVKLGVQLATHVVTGANARCIALLDALKKVVRDYSLPARTEFGRGLEAHVSRCASFLWELRPPGAAQLNALTHVRRHLTHLPADVHEFDAKKKLQEEIDRYIREQIDMAGEAISIAVRNKISDGDEILTYGCSSLVERILCEAHAAGIRFRAVVSGSRVQPGGRELLRRLLARGVPCCYVDIAALDITMKHVSKVVLGAESLLANGAVVAAAGSLAVTLAARGFNVPVLVVCETHKFSDRVHTDAFLCDELGDPNDLIDKTDENSPLKDWKSNPNLNLFNLLYDVTPPNLVTAVVTELAILPCTSAPVVLRYKLSEYGL